MIEDDIASPPRPFLPFLLLSLSLLSFRNYVADISGEFGGWPPDESRVFLPIRSEIDAHATRFLSGTRANPRGRAFFFFFFCFEAKGAYAAGLPTVCPIDRPIRLAFAIRPRWTKARPRLKLRSPLSWAGISRQDKYCRAIRPTMTRNDRIAVCSWLDCFVYDAGLRGFDEGVESMDRGVFCGDVDRSSRSGNLIERT